MRELTISGQPGPNASVQQKLDWIMMAITQIIQFSRQEGSKLADPFTITPPAGGPTRVFDPNTAVDPLTAAVLATFLSDMQNRGKNQPQRQT